MKKHIFYLLLIPLFFGCSPSIQKEDLLAHDIELFHGTKAWELAKAVEDEDQEEITELCAQDTSLISFQEKKFGQTLLEWAVYTDRLEATKALVQAGANPNIQSYNGTSAFIHAADKFETSDFLRLLLAHGGDPNAVANPKSGNQRLRTPLIAAAEANLENVKLLVEAGADIDYYYPAHFQCAINASTVFNKIEILRYLIIDQGANFKRPTLVRLEGDTMFIHQDLRNMRFKLDSEDYKIKMEVVDFLKKNGLNYWETEIPKHFYNFYDEEYLERY